MFYTEEAQNFTIGAEDMGKVEFLQNVFLFESILPVTMIFECVDEGSLV